MSDQLVIDILLSNHRINFTAAATCARPEAAVFDQFAAKFDEIVTLAANVIRERKVSRDFDFSMGIWIIQPVNQTTVGQGTLDSPANQVTAEICQFPIGVLERSRTCKHGPSGYQQRASVQQSLRAWI